MRDDVSFFLDIKPENFILTPNGQLRIIDLGLSFRLSHSQTSVLRPFAGEKTSFLIDCEIIFDLGTPEYMPPEVCQIQHGQYSRQGRGSDIWALGSSHHHQKRIHMFDFVVLFFVGVLLFEMSFGYRPFEHIHDNYEKMSFIARLTQSPLIPWTNNPHLRDVLQQCLQINPLLRPTADQLLQHSFFTN